VIHALLIVLVAIIGAGPVILLVLIVLHWRPRDDRPVAEVRPRRDQVSDHLRSCPRCGYHLRGTIDAGLDRCPECGRTFTLAELLIGNADASATPGSINPRDVVLPGRPVVLAGLVTGLVIIFLAWALLAI
jgi:hypothetical protein